MISRAEVHRALTLFLESPTGSLEYSIERMLRWGRFQRLVGRWNREQKKRSK